MSEYLFKIVVIGDPGVGKTQMRYRFTQNVYNDNSKTTIGVDFATKLLVQNNGEMVKGIQLVFVWASTHAYVNFDALLKETYCSGF